MKIKWIIILCSYVTLIIGGIQVNAQPLPAYPFPQHVEYAPDTIRPNHRTQAQQDDDVRAYYDDWKANYLIEAGRTTDNSPLYRVSFGSTNPDQTVSEGQGYGMIIVSYMAGYDPDAQVIFDGLWEFSRAHPSNIDSRLMSWRVTDAIGGDTDTAYTPSPTNQQWESNRHVTNATANESSAFDGDADIAYALLLADQQWGSDGRINYRQAATQVLAGILESTIGSISHYPMLGDWVDENGSPYNQYTFRSSDYMPAHFRAFANVTNKSEWDAVIETTQHAITQLQAQYSPNTGLLPDFIIPADDGNNSQPADPYFLEGSHDGHYFYNAGRVPLRIGADALLYNDPASLAQIQQISRWIETQANKNPLSIKAGYTLSGDPLGDYFTTFFASPFGVAAMTVPEQQRWLNAIYDNVYATHLDYYEDSITLLSLLVMTGNYWSPDDPS